MSREFTDWVRTLDELEPKGVQQSTRLAPISSKGGDLPAGFKPVFTECYLAPAPPVSRFSFSLAIVWIAGFYLMAAVCLGLVVYDLWLVFVS